MGAREEAFHVAVSTPNACASVLHVCTGPPQQVEAMDDTLRSASLDVISVGDVYRALARLCRNERNAFGGVVVCVNGLAPDDLEFFSIISRACPGLAVYVYGNDRSEWRMAKAIDLGARGATAQEVIRALTSAEPTGAIEPKGDTATAPKPAEPAPAAESAPAVAVTPAVEPTPRLLPTDHKDAKEDSEEDRTPVDGDADEPVSNSVRVPWLRYGERPLRTAPGSKSPPDRTPPSVERPLPVIKPHQPLLTDEELKALMGGDIAPADSGERDPSGTDKAIGKGGGA